MLGFPNSSRANEPSRKMKSPVRSTAPRNPNRFCFHTANESARKIIANGKRMATKPLKPTVASDGAAT
ncbi:MAG: hypothetical protein HY296_04355 [Thaumarchaeota archaeon]|nr:hypothetical protein [Nitrososphaerota archaeon]